MESYIRLCLCEYPSQQRRGSCALGSAVRVDISRYLGQCGCAGQGEALGWPSITCCTWLHYDYYNPDLSMLFVAVSTCVREDSTQQLGGAQARDVSTMHADS
jgi:hypothetical protein